MLTYQRHQLAQLLHHAKANVPFYDHRLDSVFKGNGDINWGRWNEISGRITHLFHFPDGRRIAPSLPDQEFNKGFGSKTWQLVQTGALAVELRFVQTDPTVTLDKSFAETMIHKRIYPGLQISFVLLAETPFTPAGKFIQYKSELPGPN